MRLILMLVVSTGHHALAEPQMTLAYRRKPLSPVASTRKWLRSNRNQGLSSDEWSQAASAEERIDDHNDHPVHFRVGAT